MKRLSALAFLWLLIVSPALALNQASVPPKFPIPWGNSAGGSYIRSIPTTSQIGIQNCAASLTDGFPPLTFTPSIAGGCPPFGQDMNGILKQLSQWGLWQGAGATVLFDSGFAASISGYPIGAVVAQSSNPGQFWVSTVDGNTANPDTGGSGWAPLGTAPITATTGAATTYAIGQCSATVSRSNSGVPMLDTLPGTGPGVLRSGCKLTIANNDASALLGIQSGSGAVIKNLATFAGNGILLLGPGQSATFQSDGSNYFPLARPIRAVLAANTTFYVAPSGGSDSNSGLSSGAPFATLQFAWNYLQSALDLHGYTLTLQAASGTFAHGLFAGGPFVGATGPASVILQGNVGATSSFVVTESVAATSTIDSGGGAQFTITGFKLTNSNSNLILARGAGTHIYAGVLELGSDGGAASQIGAVQLGMLELRGNLTFDFVNESAAIVLATGGVMMVPAATSITVTFVGTPVIASFIAAESLGYFRNQGTMNFIGTFTGSRYSANLNSVIDTGSGNANFFPGTTPGTTATGGQYF